MSLDERNILCFIKFITVLSKKHGIGAGLANRLEIKEGCILALCAQCFWVRLWLCSNPDKAVTEDERKHEKINFFLSCYAILINKKHHLLLSVLLKKIYN